MTQNIAPLTPASFMQTQILIPTLPDNEVTLTRVFKAPRALVWKVWTDPHHIAQWWGPSAYQKSGCILDLRPSGEFQIAMSVAQGTTFTTRGIVREVVMQEKLVFESRADDTLPCGAGLPPRSVVTVTFSDTDDGTRLELHIKLISEAARKAAVDGNVARNWAVSFDNIENHLATLW